MLLSGYWGVSACMADGKKLIPIMVDLGRVLSLRDEKHDDGQYVHNMSWPDGQSAAPILQVMGRIGPQSH